MYIRYIIIFTGIVGKNEETDNFLRFQVRAEAGKSKCRDKFKQYNVLVRILMAFAVWQLNESFSFKLISLVS